MSIETKTIDGAEKYRYRIYYEDFEGNRKQKNSKWYTSKMKCKKDENYFIAQSLNGVVKQNIKFDAVANDWLEYTSNHNTRRTKLEKQSFIKRFYTPIFGGKNIFDIKPVQIKNWLYSDLMASSGGNLFSTKYRNKVYGYLSGIFQHAVDFYDLPKNPCRSVKKLKKKFNEQKEMEVYDLNELKIFLGYIPNDKWIYCIFFRFLFYTGLRLGEARSLTWREFDGKEIYVWRQFDESTKEFSDLKTHSSIRRILLDKQTIEDLNYLKDYYKTKVCFNDDWFIFGGTIPLPKRTIDNVRVDTIKKNNLKYIRTHDLRHSHATYLINNGANVVAVSKRLGHASINMTLDRYTHLLDQSQDKLLELLQNK